MNKFFLIFLTIITGAANFVFANQQAIKMNKLTDEEKNVIINKATEYPFKGIYNKFNEKGLYLCKQCNAPLYRSSDKFDSGCGWPAFDDAITQAVKRTPDADGKRVEITCARCGGHLGHVFEGEMLTKKNTRHCVNSISMIFVPQKFIGTAIVAGGCFWGVEDTMRSLDGVLSVQSGYCGGTLKNPTYRQVCAGGTGHYEAVEILFDTRKVSYEQVLKRFFEIHDFTQTDGQGADIGEQYKSAVFTSDAEQKKAAEKILEQLRQKGFKPATKILNASAFYPAEDYHQRYYERKGTKPYCHIQHKIF